MSFDSNESKGDLRIGTSGIVVPKSKDSFQAKFRNKSRLNYYGSLFNTLEVNSTFKKIPRLSTFEKWSQDVPEEFRFTIKLWREITHSKKLNVDPANVDLFFKGANYIGNKKGCLLVQFPASITAGYMYQVENILLRLKQVNHESRWRLAIEFRSVSWYTDETYELLNRYRAAIVLHDMPQSKNLMANESFPFNYFRFHGPNGDYRGSYSDDFLSEQAENIQKRLSEGKDVYAYFNNTMGDAFENAMRLKAMIEK